MLQTDVSGVGVGCGLSQQSDDGEQGICYISRSLTKSDIKYSATERECLAVIWAVEKLNCYLEGSSFTVVIDHYSLLWLNNLKDPHRRIGR